MIRTKHNHKLWTIALLGVLGLQMSWQTPSQSQALASERMARAGDLQITVNGQTIQLPDSEGEFEIDSQRYRASYFREGNHTRIQVEAVSGECDYRCGEYRVSGVLDPENQANIDELTRVLQVAMRTEEVRNARKQKARQTEDEVTVEKDEREFAEEVQRCERLSDEESRLDCFSEALIVIASELDERGRPVHDSRAIHRFFTSHIQRDLRRAFRTGRSDDLFYEDDSFEVAREISERLLSELGLRNGQRTREAVSRLLADSNRERGSQINAQFIQAYQSQDPFIRQSLLNEATMQFNQLQRDNLLMQQNVRYGLQGLAYEYEDFGHAAYQAAARLAMNEINSYNQTVFQPFQASLAQILDINNPFGAGGQLGTNAGQLGGPMNMNTRLPLQTQGPSSGLSQIPQANTGGLGIFNNPNHPVINRGSDLWSTLGGQQNQNTRTLPGTQSLPDLQGQPLGLRAIPQVN